MAQLLELADRHYAYGKELQSSAAGKLLSLWRGVDRRHIFASWTEALPEAIAVVTATQLAAAEDGAAYMAAALAEQSLDTKGRAVNPKAFAGLAYPLDENTPPMDLAGVLVSPAFTALQGLRGGMAPDRAMSSGLSNLMLRSQMQVSDAARNSGSVVMSTRRKPAGYVRMLNPPSCSRCAILAGRWYRANQGFRRHPGCDCRHIPCAEDAADDLTTDPYEYFRSLPAAEQSRIFTNDGARAIRDGADIYQVVNARRGMSTSAGGSLVTTEGVTRRGNWGGQQQTRDRKGTERYGRSIRQRMMPEEIYKRAGNNQERALSLLQEYGYITPAGQAPGGAIVGGARGFTGRYRTG
ncbi:hypothetical protein [Arthrobacter sp. R-11]|uniref:hypothetical protein n=1 Tax=Arthrobacter sp. R-11 TaxID=3404053 RepID=UPI003CF873A2